MNDIISHPSGIPQRIVDKVVKRRGRLHAFEQLNPARTALVVIDLDSRTMEHPDNGNMRLLAPKVNAIADSLRSKSGVIAWITTPVRKASENFNAIYGQTFAKVYEGASGEDGAATTVWSGLNFFKEDLFVEKSGASAFFPGKCDLHEKLQALQIQSILIAGMVTNVCCESTARDATELDYQVTMISDAMWGHKQGQHEATLATFFRNFGDVRPTEDALKLINHIN